MSHAYLIGICLLGFLWLAFFLARKDLRRQQMLVSLFSAPLAPVSEVLWFYGDYWRPEYAWSIPVHGVPVGIEEILFAFFIGGIGSVLYEVVFRKKYVRGRARIGATLIIILVAVGTFLLLKTLNMGTVWSSAISLAVSAVCMVAVDRDVRRDMVVSSFMMLIIVFGLYFVLFSIFHQRLYQLWVPSAFSGFGLAGIPIEELVWFVSWAMFSGVVYEFAVNAGAYSPVKKVNTAHTARGKI